ncbi:Retrovirus-related Pol polyprotein from type-2 retrotransposable element R2DM [Frankliniella fusca]|uniref:Retrovirus-related Pol polyprotein from type-2 retrotransposable element R2DM n=1 Tax=Frankliniella fusca TaxID=407009 RepID=A0AAE1I412_9NEOP|nr:Retrovirus-related Pol polyprotein from type-2 retrotransposable element R2DM [Frankliniella fusca]
MLGYLAANAFGSVPHLSVLSALRRAGLAQDETSLVQDLYSSSATRVRHADGFTEPIKFGAGVRQGCPLSPVLFNIVMEAIIRTAKIGNQGYPLRGTPVSVLCYADDAVLVAPDPTTLQQMLDRVVTTADWLGLKFKPSKCASLHVKAKKTLRTDFQVGGATIHALNQGEFYQHLGVPTGFRVDATPRAAAERLEEEALKVLGSLLAPWQKIHALKTFILPQLDFSLRTARVRKTAFKNLDRAIIQGVKDVFSLPQRAGAELVYLPPSWGGAGILSLEHYIDICSLCHAFQLLTCPDPVVASLALSGLSIAAKHKMRLGRGATPAEGAAYLTGGGEAMSGLASSVWSCARAATLRLQATIPELRWEYCEARESFEIHLPGLKQPVKIEAASRSRLSSSLRLAVQLFFQRRLHGKPDQGRTPRVSTMNAVSNHFLYDGRYTRFADWRFIFRARLGVLPINGCMRWRQDPAARRCRRGCAFDETTAHVLNHCPASLAAGTRRHNAVLSRLEAALKEKKNITVRVNQQVPFDLLTPGVLPGQNIVRQRPDLVVINQAERRISYVDVTIPFEDGWESFRAARGRKETTYAESAQHLRSQGWAVKMSKYAYYRMKNPKSVVQRGEALKLCELAGIDPQQPCGIDEVQKLQAVLPDYRLCIFSDKEGKECVFKGIWIPFYVREMHYLLPSERGTQMVDENDHLCYMQRWTKREKKDKWTYVTIYYDIETTQCKPVEGKPDTFEHKPNLLVSQAVCDKCVNVAQNDHFCAACKTRQHVFHNLDDPNVCVM